MCGDHVLIKATHFVFPLDLYKEKEVIIKRGNTFQQLPTESGWVLEEYEIESHKWEKSSYLSGQTAHPKWICTECDAERYTKP